MGKVRATRHNGRKGKDGVFKAGHNDRTFKVENAEHIDANRSFMNVYWDCYQGYNLTDENGNRPERKFNFEQIEHAYYAEHFGDSIDAQNDRHIKSRHKERIRSVGDILKDPKTCPEETVYQLGTKDGHEDAALFAKVVAELFEEIEKRYGSNYKILDWSLHMDEETPHIHERHVFFADDGWVVVENMHEPIIDQDTFDIVQEKIKSRKCSRGDGTTSLFAGLIKCGECGKTLTNRKTNAKNPKDIYACVTYNRHGMNHCTQHRIEYDELYDIVLNEIRISQIRR